MPVEQYTESIVLREMKCVPGENDFGFCFPQGDVPQIDKGEDGAAVNGKAKPEYLITFNKKPAVIIVVECKRTAAKHISEKLDRPKDYAVDGVLYYAKFLKDDYNVIALAVSGTKKDSIRANAYYWQKGREEYTEIKKARDIIYEPENYLRLVSGEAVKKAVSIQEIQELALEMHESLRGLSVTERAKPVFIAGILIALKDEDFVKEYPNLVSFNSLLNRLQYAISNVLENSDVRKDKIKDIKSQFDRIGRIEKLKNIPLGHYNSLLWYIEKLEKKIKPMMDFADNTIDALGIFYHEFVKYSGGDGSGLGIVLTPQHLTEFMCDLAEVNKNSKIVDICCGSGTFLVTAMSKMFKGANDKDIARIRNESLFGIESNDEIYTLAVANMIVRGDGKSNIIFGDCFKQNIIDELKQKNINIGLINPPYSQDITELEFVENMLDILTTGGTGVVVVPMSCAIGTKSKETRLRLFKKHTLKAVFSMPDDIFYSKNVNTSVCVMVWEAHKPHDSAKTTFFGYYKDDGFVKAKKLGRIDKFNKWKSIEDEWLRLYRERETKEGISVKKSVDWNDEWLCEAYMETDYSVLAQEDFELTVRKNLAYLIFSGKANLDNNKFKNTKRQFYDVMEWGVFNLTELFSIERGVRLTKENRIQGDIPLATAGETNEGISSYISNDDMQIYANVLTIDMFCNCFYRDYDFACDDNILVLFPKFEYNKYVLLFMAAIIGADKYRYAYGRQYRQKNFREHKIKLPVGKNKIPDWQFMENYIKSLPYSEKI
ncbi:MAG: N-6 DNA methylase [Spirochaetaceae bacterium]|nr:N-6 DNA methylase [Spirochaetaceae bacterium]